MRRKKKLLLNLLKVIVVIAIILAIYFIFFHKENTIDTVEDEKEGQTNELHSINGIREEIVLPENIYSEDTLTDSNDSENSGNQESTGNNKTYTPSTASSEKYLIPVLANNELSILIGNDSEKLLDQNSPIQIGAEYIVSGIEKKLRTEYYFNVDGYDYPILLLVDTDGVVTYVDIEEGYHTGTFEVSGTITGIPSIDKIYETTVEENGYSYRTAVLVGTDGQGYEFKLSMIGK